MDIQMDVALGASYHSPQQQARVITEAWAAENMYCVMCGEPHLVHLQNNKPVADLLCPSCKNVFELKSHNGRFGSVIADGSYGRVLPLCDTTGHKRDCPCSAGNTQGRFFQRPRG